MVHLSRCKNSLDCRRLFAQITKWTMYFGYNSDIRQLIESFLAVHLKLQSRTPVLCQGINSCEHRAHLNFFCNYIYLDF